MNKIVVYVHGKGGNSAEAEYYKPLFIDSAVCLNISKGGLHLSGNNHFPHDREHGKSCSGYGCNCDVKNYGHQSGGRKSSGESGGAWVLAFIVIMCRWQLWSLTV